MKHRAWAITSAALLAAVYLVLLLSPSSSTSPDGAVSYGQAGAAEVTTTPTATPTTTTAPHLDHVDPSESRASLSATAASPETWHTAPPAVVKAVTHVPQSVFDDVGLQPDVTAPVILSGQHPLSMNGKPEIFYLGSEPCPFCAAQRWAFVLAMSRFGTWSRLGIAQSARDDVDPSTATFTFSHARYSSPYVSVVTVERLGNDKLPNGKYANLQPLSIEQNRLYKKYTSTKYFPGNAGSYPFEDFGNRVVMSSSNFDPDVLHGLSLQQIAADLSNTASPVTRDIVATSNYLTAATCLIDGGRPASVCQSPVIIQSERFDKFSYGGGGGTCSVSSKSISVCGGPEPSKQR